MALILIYAFEKRDVVIFDVPGAYLFADIDDKFVWLIIEGDFVKIMYDINSDFSICSIRKRKPYIVFAKPKDPAWNDLASITLVLVVKARNGFALNLVDKCIVNMILDRKQCTIGFYLDDHMISHVKESTVDDI